jgi:hypothetical protein
MSFSFSFRKSENREVKQVLSEGVGASGKMVKEGEYGANTVYTCI